MGGGNVGTEMEALAVEWLTEEEVGTASMTAAVSVSLACFFRAVLFFLLLRLAAVLFAMASAAGTGTTGEVGGGGAGEVGRERVNLKESEE